MYEDETRYRAFFSSEEWDAMPFAPRERISALSYADAHALAREVERYEHLSVVDISGDDERGCWIGIEDELTDECYEIYSEEDLRDLVDHLAHSKPDPVGSAADDAAEVTR